MKQTCGEKEQNTRGEKDLWWKRKNTRGETVKKWWKRKDTSGEKGKDTSKKKSGDKKTLVMKKNINKCCEEEHKYL